MTDLTDQIRRHLAGHHDPGRPEDLVDDMLDDINTTRFTGPDGTLDRTAIARWIASLRRGGRTSDTPHGEHHQTHTAHTAPDLAANISAALAKGRGTIDGGTT